MISKLRALLDAHQRDGDRFIELKVTYMSELLDRLEKLEAVAKATQNYVLDEEQGVTGFTHEPWDRLKQTLAELEMK